MTRRGRESELRDLWINREYTFAVFFISFETRFPVSTEFQDAEEAIDLFHTIPRFSMRGSRIVREKKERDLYSTLPQEENSY